MDNDPSKPLDPDSEASAKTARKLLALVSALETAREGSRKLDRAIRDCVRSVVIPWRDLTVPLSGLPEIDGHRASTTASYLPFYTTSLDAALSLVPEGMYWLVAEGRTRPDEPLYGAEIRLPDLTVIGEAESNASPAVTLVIACLKTRLAQGIVTRRAETRRGSGSEHRERVEPDPEGDAPKVIGPVPSGTSEGGVRK